MKNLKKKTANKLTRDPLSISGGGFAYRLLIPLLAPILFGGCLLKPWIPVSGEDYAVEDRYAVVSRDSLTVIARPQAYSGEADVIADRYFTLWLRVRNDTSRPLNIPRESFSILAERKQFDPVPLQIVLGTVQTDLYLNSFDDPFTDDPFTTERAEKAREQYLELAGSYFSFGTLLPGGVKEGWLFYDSRIDREKAITIDLLGVPVVFVR